MPWVAVGFSAASAWLAWDAVKAARVPLRPEFGRPTIAFASDLEYQGDSATITFNVDFKNIGKTPAKGFGTHIVATAEPYPWQGQKWRAAIKAECRDAVDQITKNGWGDHYVVEPGDTFRQRYPFAPQGPDQQDLRFTIALKQLQQFIPMFYGCIVYAANFETDARHIFKTGLVFTLMKKTPHLGEGGARYPDQYENNPFFRPEGTVRQDDLQIVRIYTVAPTD